MQDTRMSKNEGVYRFGVFILYMRFKRKLTGTKNMLIFRIIFLYYKRIKYCYAKCDDSYCSLTMT